MRYAFSQVNINPHFPVKQAGFIQQVDPIDEVHDDLMARIMALDDGKMIFVSVSMDVLGIDLMFQKEVAALVRHCWDKPCTLTVSCTHTHFAGDVTNHDYRSQLLDQVTEAIQNLQFVNCGEITVSYKVTDADGLVGTCRISHHSGIVRLGLIELYADDEKIAQIICHNCHPTIMSGADTHFFSSEYPGYVTKGYMQNHPGVFCSYLQGASGDISTRFTRKTQGYESVIELGNRLLSKVEELEKAEAERMPLSLQYREKTISCAHEFNEINFDEIPEDISERELETIGYGKIVRERLASHPEKWQKDVLISRLSLGRLALVFAPNELFSDYNRYVDRDNAFLACYSNGYSPYVTPVDEKLLTYETFTDTLTRETKLAIIETLKEYGN